jgi:hypothetical protein
VRGRANRREECRLRKWRDVCVCIFHNHIARVQCTLFYGFFPVINFFMKRTVQSKGKKIQTNKRHYSLPTKAHNTSSFFLDNFKNFNIINSFPPLPLQSCIKLYIACFTVIIVDHNTFFVKPKSVEHSIVFCQKC